MSDIARAIMLLCGFMLFVGALVFMAREAIERVRHRRRISDNFYASRGAYEDHPRIPGRVSDRSLWRSGRAGRRLPISRVAPGPAKAPG